MAAIYSQHATVRDGGRQVAYRILIVDDRRTTREILEVTLQRVGYRSSSVSSAAEALEKLAEERFDLVITDLLMPNMSGLELLCEIRKKHSRTDLPVLFLTVQEEGEELVAAMRNGANDYVCKPINYPVLLARLETHLGLRETVLDLKRSKERAEARNSALLAASRASEQLDSGFSKELITLTRTMRAHLKPLLRRFSDDDTAGTHLGSIAGGVGYLERAANGLMMMARVSTQDVRPQRVQLSELVSGLWTELGLRRDTSGVELSVDPHIVVNSDAWLLRVLIAELLDNARKFCGNRNGARVTFGLRVQGGARTYYVSDTGACFAPEDAHRMFVLFERLAEGKRFEGSGVGLAVVRQCIERLGGRVWAEGARGLGATFCFTLEREISGADTAR
jgi:two-component system sensor histidine kinase/response regulator